MKSLVSQVTTQMAAEQSRPVLLYTINFSTPLYFAASKSNLVFPTLGTTYTAKAINFDSIQQSSTNNTFTIRIQFDNVAQDMAAYADVYDFEGVVINIKRVYRDALGSATYYDELFNGTIETYEMDYYWCTITARSGVSLSTRCPNKIFQKKCPLIFGGSECNRDGFADITTTPLKVTGTADSGSTTTLVDDALTQTAQTFKYGILTCTEGGVTESRIVIDFASPIVTVDTAFSFTVDATTTYSLVAGCDKTLAACKGDYAYGPTADNSNNYGGFPYVGKRPFSLHPGQAGGYVSSIEQPYSQEELDRIADYYLGLMG